MSTTDWPHAGRVVWLSGGLVAYNNPGALVELCAGSNGPPLARFNLLAYGALFDALRKQGLSIIGTTFVVSADELAALRPAEFRVAGIARGWPLCDLRQKWRQIAFEAGKRDQMQLMDITSRIASNLQYAQMRTLDVVAAYSLQLRAIAEKKELQITGQNAFRDLNSSEVYKTIHALFWQLAVLRDSLAEFTAVFCLGGSGIGTISGLRKMIKQKGSTDPMAALFGTITDPIQKGWLYKFGTYRDFFTHSAPLEMANGFGFAIQDMRDLADGRRVPQIYYPLPGNIQELTQKRSKGVFFRTLAEMAEASRSSRNRVTDPDALEYLHICLDEFCLLAATLISRSPIEPKMISLGPSDIIGEITITPGDVMAKP